MEQISKWQLLFLTCLLLLLVLLACCTPRCAAEVQGLHHELLSRLSAFALPPGAARSAPQHPQDLDYLAQELASAAHGKRQVRGQVRPVVIVSGMVASKLQAQLDGYKSAHWYCWTEWKEWFTLWINFEDLIAPLTNCWYEQMTLHLDPSTGRSYNTPGVNTRVVDYGGVDGVTYLDDYGEVPLWNETVYLLQALGWQVGKNLRAAPYDWRFGPETWAAEDWPRLRALIEDTYALNNNTRVAVVSVSMGSPYFLGFLNQQSQAWKDRFIDSFVSLAGAFGGSPSATSVLISTSGWWAAKVADPAALRAMVQSWPSSVWMLPLAQLYGDDYDWVKVTNPPRNYTSADFARMLSDAKGHNASLILRLLQSQNWLRFEAPGVTTHCFFGTNVSTPMSMTYATAAFDTLPEVVYGDGDGVVPEAGLRMLERWRGEQAQPIYSYPIQGSYHGTIMWNKQMLRMLIEILGSP